MAGTSTSDPAADPLPRAGARRPDPEAAAARLPLTGERTLPGIEVENYWYRRHEAAYRAVPGWLPATGRVLEAGLGEGYGADLLAGTGRPVVGLDYDESSARHAARAYPRIPVVRGNVVALPFRTGSFAGVVSLQVIEHLWDQPGYLAECVRVLRPGGTLVVSTPNRLTFSPGYRPGEDRPRNLFHTREFDAAELAELVGRYATVQTLTGLRAGPRLVRLDADLRRATGTGLVAAQLASAPEHWSAELRRAVATVTAADFELSTVDIHSALDLVLVAVRDG